MFGRLTRTHILFSFSAAIATLLGAAWAKEPKSIPALEILDRPTQRTRDLWECGLVFKYQEWLEFYVAVSRKASDERLRLLKDKVAMTRLIFSAREILGKNRDEEKKLKATTEELLRGADRLHSILAQKQFNTDDFSRELSRVRENALIAARQELTVAWGDPQKAEAFLDLNCVDCKPSVESELDHFRAQSLAINSLSEVQTKDNRQALSRLPVEWITPQFQSRCDQYLKSREEQLTNQETSTGVQAESLKDARTVRLAAQLTTAQSDKLVPPHLNKIDPLGQKASEQEKLYQTEQAKIPQKTETGKSPPRPESTPQVEVHQSLAQSKTLSSREMSTRRNSVASEMRQEKSPSSPTSAEVSKKLTNQKPVCVGGAATPALDGEDQETDPCAVEQISAAEKKAQAEKEQKEILDLLKELRAGGELPRFIESPLLKKPVDREKLEPNAGAQPLQSLKPLDEAQWRKRAQDALDEFKKTRELGSHFVLSEHWLELEARVAKKPTETFNENLALWSKSIQRYQTLQSQPEAKELNPLQTLIKPLFEDYLGRRDPNATLMSDYLQRGVGNDQAATRLILAAIRESQVPVPEYLKLAIEVDPKTGKTAPVLLHRSTGEVTQLMTGEKIQTAPIVDPAYLVARDLNNGAVDLKDYLLKAMPPPLPTAKIKKESPQQTAKAPSSTKANPSVTRVATPHIDTSGSFLDRIKALGDVLGLVADWIKTLFQAKLSTADLVQALSALVSRTPDLLKQLGQIDLKQFGVNSGDLGALGPEQNKNLMAALAGKLSPEDVKAFTERLKAGEYDQEIEGLVGELSRNDPKWSGLDAKAFKNQIASQLAGNEGKDTLKAALKNDGVAKLLGDPSYMGSTLRVSLGSNSRSRDEIFLRNKTDQEIVQEGRIRGSANGVQLVKTQLSAQDRNRVKSYFESAEGRAAIGIYPALIQSEIKKKVLSNEYGEWVEGSETWNDRMPLASFDQKLGDPYTPENIEKRIDQQMRELGGQLQVTFAPTLELLEKPDLLLAASDKKVSVQKEQVKSLSTLSSLWGTYYKKLLVDSDLHYRSRISDRTYSYLLERDSKWLERAKKRVPRKSSVYIEEESNPARLPVRYDNINDELIVREEILTRVPEIELYLDQLDRSMERVQKKPEAHLKLLAKMSPGQMQAFLLTQEGVQSARVQLHSILKNYSERDGGWVIEQVMRNDALPGLDLISKLDPKLARVKVAAQGQKQKDPQDQNTALKPQSFRMAQNISLGWLPQRGPKRQELTQPAQTLQFEKPESKLVLPQSPQKGKKDGVTLLQKEEEKPIELSLEQWRALSDYVDKAVDGGHLSDQSFLARAHARAALDRLISQNMVRAMNHKVAYSQDAESVLGSYHVSHFELLSHVQALGSFRPESEERIVLNYEGWSYVLTVDLAALLLENQYLWPAGRPLEVPFNSAELSSHQTFSEFLASPDISKKSLLVRSLVQALETQTPYQSVHHYWTGQTENAQNPKLRKGQFAPVRPEVWKKIPGALPGQSP